MDMDNDANRYNANALGDIKTLNYACCNHLITPPSKDAPVKELKFTLTGKYEPLCGAWIIKYFQSDKIPVKKEKFYGLPFIIIQ
jgi:hypothetical protein